MSGRPAKVRSRIRTQWLALGAAFVVLAGVLVAWALSNAAERVQVVQVVDQVKAGDVIELDDLAVTGIAYDASLEGLVPEQSLEALVGRVAAIDIAAGTLLIRGMWEDAPVVATGESVVGAVLPPGRYPAGLGRGDGAVAAAIDPTSEIAPVAVRVITTTLDPDGGVVVQLAVPSEYAVTIGQLAATEQLLLVGEPATSAP
ncbi:MAG: SAF domain-containing protein [Ilumatobacteraceae bacterium]